MIQTPTFQPVPVTQQEAAFILDQLSNSIEHFESPEAFAAHVGAQTSVPQEVLQTLFINEAEDFLSDSFHFLSYDPSPYYFIQQ